MQLLIRLLIRLLKQNLALVSFGLLLSAFNAAQADSDMQMQEKMLKARELGQQHTDHSAHTSVIDPSQEFHGVFYGYAPCKDCNGVKLSLSLKQNSNYLLVTQYAKESSREIYEKGKYTWDDKTHTVVLTPRKDGAIRQLRIQDEGTLVQLNSDGTPIDGDQDDYVLHRSDTVKSRQVHIH